MQKFTIHFSFRGYTTAKPNNDDHQIEIWYVVISTNIFNHFPFFFAILCCFHIILFLLLYHHLRRTPSNTTALVVFVIVTHTMELLVNEQQNIVNQKTINFPISIHSGNFSINIFIIMFLLELWAVFGERVSVFSVLMVLPKIHLRRRKVRVKRNFCR